MKLTDFIKDSPTPFHAIKNCSAVLEQNGAVCLSEADEWKLERGKTYFVTRNLSSIIAFKIPKTELSGFNIAASHCDSPCFKLKENPELEEDFYVKLSVEKYGGMLCSAWLDRPLSVGGRVIVKEDSDTLCSKLVRIDNCALIPNLAIHMNRSANDGMKYNPAVDMIPITSGFESRKSLYELISEKLGGAEIVSSDLILYNPAEPLEWNDFISAPRLDDLQCVYSSLLAFINAENSSSAASVFAVFDNEEVGSMTKQGADSTFLYDVIERIEDSLSRSVSDRKRDISNSFMLSCDNAHAVHPNYPDICDKNHEVYMNKGIVIKYNANQKYTSDAVSAGIFKMICNKAGVPYQIYANRADMPGGSTLGNISNSHISLNTVDIGLAQLAMHSSFETAGIKDTDYMIKAIKCFYQISLKTNSNEKIIINGGI